MIDAEKRRWG